MTRGWEICSSASAPHCPSSPPSSKSFDSHGSQDILFLTGFVSFLPRSDPHASTQPIRLPLTGFYFWRWSYPKLSLLESLSLVLKSLSYFPFSCLHCRRPTHSSKHTTVSPASPSPGLSHRGHPHGCLVANMGHLLRVFLARHICLLALFGIFIPFDNLLHSFPFSPISPKISSPVFVKMGLLSVFSAPWASVVFPESQSP